MPWEWCPEWPQRCPGRCPLGPAKNTRCCIIAKPVFMQLWQCSYGEGRRPWAIHSHISCFDSHETFAWSVHLDEPVAHVYHPPVIHIHIHRVGLAVGPPCFEQLRRSLLIHLQIINLYIKAVLCSSNSLLNFLVSEHLSENSLNKVATVTALR